MKKWIALLVLATILATALVACGGEGAAAAVDPAGARTGGEGAVQADEPSAAQDNAPAAADSASLTADYGDALPVAAQLAFGTLQLEQGDLALTAEQAEVLLPYWRVLQSLSQSDNTAEAEINAVVKQIENGMTGEQIAAIAAMALTEEKLQTMLDEGTINFGFGGRFGGAAEGETGGGFSPGGPPGGGLLGGGPGGGAGGGPGGFGGDPGAFATRQAELEAGGENPLAAMIDRISSAMVIRLLETKTGEAPEGGPGALGVFGGFGAVFGVAGELTGLSEEELGAAMAEGRTLAEILEANGVSTDEAREAMKEALADVQLPGDLDLETWIDDLLSGTFPADRQRGGE